MPTTQAKQKKKISIERLTAWVLTLTGAGGVFASLMLSVEEFHHLKHPAQKLACDLNPLVGCGSILDTWQGHAFLGIPNQFFGLAAFAALTTLGVLLLAGIKYPRWIWKGLQVGMLGGVVFVVWFMFESLFVLKHLCPYCMFTWFVTLMAAWYTTVYNLHAKTFVLPKSVKKFGDFAVRHHVDILVSVYLIIIVGILWRFWDFFGQNL